MIYYLEAENGTHRPRVIFYEDELEDARTESERLGKLTKGKIFLKNGNGKTVEYFDYNPPEKKSELIVDLVQQLVDISLKIKDKLNLIDRDNH